MTYESTNSGILSALKTYALKKDIPKGEHRTVLKINFGIYGCRLALKGFHGLLCKNGEEMPCHIAHLHGVGAVIGPKDLEAARHRKFAEAWRESYSSAINDRMGLV